MGGTEQRIEGPCAVGRAGDFTVAHPQLYPHDRSRHESVEHGAPVRTVVRVAALGRVIGLVAHRAAATGDAGAQGGEVAVTVRAPPRIQKIVVEAQAVILDAFVDPFQNDEMLQIDLGIENGLHPPNAADDELQIRQGFVANQNGIKALVVLAPADVAHQPVVVQDDLLPPQPHLCIGEGLIFQITLVHGRACRIGDGIEIRILGRVILQSRRAHVLEVQKRRGLAPKWRRAIAQSGAQDQSRRGFCSTLQIGRLVAPTQI